MKVARNSAAQLVHRARKNSGLTQKELASRATTTQVEVSDYERGVRSPNYTTFERILDAAGQRVITIPKNRNDSSDTAALISEALKYDDTERVFRYLLDYSDGLNASEGVDRIVLALTEPGATGSALWDSAIAAVTDYWLSKDNLPLPQWVTSEKRVLPRPTALVTAVSEYNLPPEVENVADEFLRHNVLLEAATLQSV
ncbi:hypothetical protein ADILRU_1673 [Leifsonia rubra CMS 76R]|nr:hypothetical protein ADILRU_1673 [Leifsonia rubra CMS 76R]